MEEKYLKQMKNLMDSDFTNQELIEFIMESREQRDYYKDESKFFKTKYFNLKEEVFAFMSGIKKLKKEVDI